MQKNENEKDRIDTELSPFQKSLIEIEYIRELSNRKKTRSFEKHDITQGFSTRVFKQVGQLYSTEGEIL